MFFVYISSKPLFACRWEPVLPFRVSFVPIGRRAIEAVLALDLIRRLLSGSTSTSRLNGVTLRLSMHFGWGTYLQSASPKSNNAGDSSLLPPAERSSWLSYRRAKRQHPNRCTDRPSAVELGRAECHNGEARLWVRSISLLGKQRRTLNAPCVCVCVWL
jgi:hypothetical protein